MRSQFVRSRGAAIFGLLLLLLILPQCSSKSSEQLIAEGLEQLENDRTQDAQHSFMRAIDASPKRPEGYYHLGSAFNAQKQYDRAIEQFLIALKLDPTHYDAHFSLGYAYEQVGDKEKAEKEFVTYRRLKKMAQKVDEDFQARR